MKKIILFIIGIGIFLSCFDVFAGIFDTPADVIYCPNNLDGTPTCSLTEWTQTVKDGLTSINTTDTTSVYVQNIVKYLLTFLSIIAVIYVIYAWFKILVSGWNEEDIKKSKTTIFSVVIGIIIIWLAYAIVSWILKFVTLTI